MVVNSLNDVKLLILSTKLFRNSHGLRVSFFPLVELTRSQLFRVRGETTGAESKPPPS